jgi:RNA polymerase sigma-70 factor (ECF subfamily)
MAFALTRSAADADDLTQQTLLALLTRRPDRVDHVGYARRVMVHVWLDGQRSLRRRLRRMARLASSVVPRHTETDRMSLSEEHERVRQALTCLPPQQQAVLVLRLIEGLDYAEIAEVLGSSLDTVRANLHLARQRIRRLVGEVV